MGKKRTYTKEDLQMAINDVHMGMSFRKAAKKHGVPVMTISDRVTGKSEGDLHLGRPPTISADLENDIARKLKLAALQGFGITRRQLIIKVSRICKQLGIKNPFKGGIPGKKWIAGFLKRHPDVKLRTPVALSTVRARMLNPIIVDKYFETLGGIIDTLGLSQKPQLIWNIDETGVPLTHQPAKVFAETGIKNIPGRVGNDRDRVTVLACVNATGNTIPPMAIVKGKTQRSLGAYNTKLGVPGTVYTYQERAWMEDQLGERWFEDHFLRYCGSERPQLIILDSHSSHETLGFLEKARENNITVLAFPPHTTQWLCPLDKTVFSSFSREWSFGCSEYMSSSPNNIVCKWEWPRLFRAAYDKAFTASNIINGFRKCGIFPFNPTAIPRSAFAPSQPFDKASTSNSKVANPETPEAANDAVTRKVAATPDQTPSTSAPQEPDLPEGAEVLTAEEFILSVLSGDVPSSFDESGNMIVEIASDEGMSLRQLEAVNKEFSLPETKTSEGKVNPRKLTSHRILTSDHIIEMKRKKVEQKRKNEAEKKARKEQRELKQKLKKNDN
ncbi:tigger transposable element-derived protein 6-like [Haliotis asinina]|uniref:tigger transposable element-derived protein 6-like n=1 Tax=Haliotis asinina TaxID=109174 RepID=UPI003531ACFB